MNSLSRGFRPLMTAYGVGGGECGIAASCPVDDGATEFTSISLEGQPVPAVAELQRRPDVVRIVLVT